MRLFVLAALALAGCDGTQPATANKIAAVGAAPAPALRLAGRVTDAADVLPPAAEAALTERLAALERRTRHQMVVVTVPSLGGREIDDYTIELARRWGIGRRGANDGVVVLLAPNEMKVRIEVGLGLETTLTNALCREIIDRVMLPRFRAGDLAGGIEAGVAALVERLDPPGRR